MTFRVVQSRDAWPFCSEVIPAISQDLVGWVRSKSLLVRVAQAINLYQYGRDIHSQQSFKYVKSQSVRVGRATT